MINASIIFNFLLRSFLLSDSQHSFAFFGGELAGGFFATDCAPCAELLEGEGFHISSPGCIMDIGPSPITISGHLRFIS